MKFPSKEEALQIALEEISKTIEVAKVTDNELEITGAYNLPPGCWYIIYTMHHPGHLILQSSCYIAVSKVDGRIIAKGSLSDEG